MTDCYIDANGLWLHYLDRGGSGPELILLPGLTANAHSFDALASSSYLEVEGNHLTFLFANCAGLSRKGLPVSSQNKLLNGIETSARNFA